MPGLNPGSGRSCSGVWVNTSDIASNTMPNELDGEEIAQDGVDGSRRPVVALRLPCRSGWMDACRAIVSYTLVVLGLGAILAL